jgi:hypothetical protein
MHVPTIAGHLRTSMKSPITLLMMDKGVEMKIAATASSGQEEPQPGCNKMMEP